MDKNKTQTQNIENSTPNKNLEQQTKKRNKFNEFINNYLHLLLIAMIFSKITSSFILNELYLSYTLLNPEDIIHNQIYYIFLYSFTLYTYYLSIFTSPHQTNIDIYFYQKSQQILNIDNFLYYDCEFCNQKKYIRSSHCRQCKKCIICRDHHCPYIGNCVGLKNIQYFINFLFMGSYAMVVQNLSYLKYYFDKENNNMNFSLTVKILFALDFSFNIGFFNAVVSLLLKSLLVVYSNRTTLEKNRDNTITENFFCCNIYANSNKLKNNNNWNIGFLAHFYHFIGISPLQFFFPLNKFSNYIVDENLPPLLGCKKPESLQIFKFLIKNNLAQKENLLYRGDADPDNYIKLCHEIYDGKIIN